jgi:hypothetical protein
LLVKELLANLSDVTDFDASTAGRCVGRQQCISVLGSILLVEEPLANLSVDWDMISSASFDASTVGFITPKTFVVELHSAVRGQGEQQYTIKYFLGAQPSLAPPNHHTCNHWELTPGLVLQSSTHDA